MRFTRSFWEISASYNLSLVDYWLVNDKVQALR